MVGPSPQVVGQYARDIRDKARAQGRVPANIKIMAFIKVITGPTAAAARQKLEEFSIYISYDGALANGPCAISRPMSGSAARDR